MPKQTLTVYRAAVAQYVAWREGGNAREVARSLPSVNPLRKGVDREKLTPTQLGRYRELAEAAREPQRTILLLLPLTGCRISELCSLTRENVDSSAIRVYAKRGKERKIPLNETARKLLGHYLARHGGSTAQVFEIEETWGGEPLDEPRGCTPRDVWRVVETWEADRVKGGLLHGVTLHQTRHTAASAMVKRGASLAVVKDFLGHESLRTLSRYVHPDEDELVAAAGMLDG